MMVVQHIVIIIEIHALFPYLLLTLESNLVTHDKFGGYITSLHAHNYITFIAQFQVTNTVPSYAIVIGT